MVLPILAAVGGFFAGLWTFFKTALSTIWSIVSWMFAFLWSMISSAMQTLPPMFKMIFGVIITFIVMDLIVAMSFGFSYHCNSNGELFQSDFTDGTIFKMKEMMGFKNLGSLIGEIALPQTKAEDSVTETKVVQAKVNALVMQSEGNFKDFFGTPVNGLKNGSAKCNVLDDSLVNRFVSSDYFKMGFPLSAAGTQGVWCKQLVNICKYPDTLDESGNTVYGGCYALAGGSSFYDPYGGGFSSEAGDNYYTVEGLGDCRRHYTAGDFWGIGSGLEALTGWENNWFYYDSSAEDEFVGLITYELWNDKGTVALSATWTHAAFSTASTYDDLVRSCGGFVPADYPKSVQEKMSLFKDFSASKEFYLFDTKKIYLQDLLSISPEVMGEGASKNVTLSNNQARDQALSGFERVTTKDKFTGLVANEASLGPDDMFNLRCLNNGVSGKSKLDLGIYKLYIFNFTAFIVAIGFFLLFSLVGWLSK